MANYYYLKFYHNNNIMCSSIRRIGRIGGKHTYNLNSNQCNAVAVCNASESVSHGQNRQKAADTSHNNWHI